MRVKSICIETLSFLQGYLKILLSGRQTVALLKFYNSTSKMETKPLHLLILFNTGEILELAITLSWAQNLSVLFH